MGPGLGRSLALRFAKGGCDVAICSRNLSRLEPIAAEIRALGVKALPLEVDALYPDALETAFARIRNELSDPSILIHNGNLFERRSFEDETSDSIRHAWEMNCLAAFNSAKAAAPAMIKAGAGTILFTGGITSLDGAANVLGASIGKFGLRALAQSLYHELGPKGVFVGHAVVLSIIDTSEIRDQLPADFDERRFLNPDEIADVFWRMHRSKTSEPEVIIHNPNTRGRPFG